jgi:hypothetical protein
MNESQFVAKLLNKGGIGEVSKGELIRAVTKLYQTVVSLTEELYCADPINGFFRGYPAEGLDALKAARAKRCGGRMKRALRCLHNGVKEITRKG